MKIEASVIKEIAEMLGFDACGISQSKISADNISFLKNWLDNNSNAEMHYMANRLSIRENPEILLENVKSVISVLLSYNVDSEESSEYYIAKYARGKDYHNIVKSKLKEFERKLHDMFPEINTRVFVDSAPILERAFARNSGLGFIGKNTCLINPKLGSFVFIGEILADFETSFDNDLEIDCGDCNLCLDSCPTGALSEGGLDANKCISYHTIENKEDIPEEIAEKITNQTFGCDICQNVCPYNQKAKLSINEEFALDSKIKKLNAVFLESMTNSQFKKQYKNTALNRVKRQKLINNFKIVDRNKG